MRSVSLSFARDGQRGVVVVEGPDAAGKGGAVRRLTAEMDPRHYAVWPIGPPSAEDAMHHYLWRFWQRLPARGQIGIFDRSWYGRVLVERVEELTPEARWRQAFEELGTFERSLARDGVRIVKLYFHVSRDEQQKRLLERVHDPFKHWKISTADIQAFAKREQYEEAATEMLQRTGSDEAPWHVIAADDKRHARIAMLEIVTSALSKDVDVTPRPLDPKTRRLARKVLGDQH